MVGPWGARSTFPPPASTTTDGTSPLSSPWSVAPSNTCGGGPSQPMRSCSHSDERPYDQHASDIGGAAYSCSVARRCWMKLCRPAMGCRARRCACYGVQATRPRRGRGPSVRCVAAGGRHGCGAEEHAWCSTLRATAPPTAATGSHIALHAARHGRVAEGMRCVGLAGSATCPRHGSRSRDAPEIWGHMPQKRPESPTFLWTAAPHNVEMPPRDIPEN